MAEKFSLTAQLNLQAPTNVKQVFNNIQKQLSGATVNVNVANSAKAVKDLNNVANATQKIEKESKKAAKGADVMGKAFGSALKNVLRYDLARRVFSAFTNTVEQGIKDAIDFERAMIRIAQVSGQTMQQLKGLQNTITNLSTSLGVSSSSLVKVGLILKQTGLSVKDTQLAMAALAKTELAPTFDNITDTAETAVAAMRQFGLEASRLESLLGKINTVAANFAVEASDIGVAIKRAGGAFKAAGGQVEELIALFTSVRATTRETAETIATGFRTIFTRLQRPTTIKFLRQFGIELTDLKGKFVGPYEAVRRLSNALSGLDPRDLRFSAIVEQLGGFRQVSKVIPMIQKFNTAQAAMKAQMEGSGSLAKDAATAQQSLAVQIQKLTENVKEMFRAVAESTAFQALAKLALGLANAVAKVGKALAPVLPILGAFVAARAAAWAGGKLMGGGIGGLNRSLGSAMGDTSDVYKGNRGGRVRRFSKGGWVPGTGNGDTVPAMLEPGEFVLRKSAAQAFGPRLNGINKYADGGKSKDGTKISRTPSLAKALFQDVYDGDSYRIHGIPSATKWKTTTRLDGADAYELRTGTPREKLLGKLAKEAAQQHAAFSVDQNIVGMMDVDPKRKEKFGRPIMHDKALADSLIKQGLGESGRATGGLDDRITEYAKSGRARAGIGKGLAADHYREWIRERKQQLKAAPIEANKGGEIPSLLTPGEFVVNKKSAQAFGYGKLRKMNRYNQGGKTGGGGAMHSGGIPVSASRGTTMALEDLRAGAVGGAKGLYQMSEAATMGAAKNVMYVQAAGAFAEQLGMGGDALDFWTSTLSTSSGILGGFNSMMDQAEASGFMDQLGGFADMLGDKNSKVGGILDSFGGKLSKKGGLLGKVGKGVQGMGGGLKQTMGNVQDLRDKGIFHKGVTKYEGKAADIEARKAKLEGKSGKFHQKATMQAKRAEAMKGSADNLGKSAGKEFGKARQLRAEQQKLVTKRTTPMGKAGRAEYHKLGKMADEAEAAGKALKAQGQAAGDAAKKFAKSSATNMKNSKKAAAVAKKFGPQLGKAAKGAKLAAMGLKALNPVAIIAEVAIGKLGAAIEKNATDKIGALDFEREGGTAGSETKIKAQAAAGGALKGGAAGAGIGAAVGSVIPVVGTLIGAIAGGVIGAAIGAISAWVNAAKLIKQAKFNAKLKSMGQAMDNYSKGLTDSKRVAASISDMDTAIEDFGHAMKMEDVIAAQKKQAEIGKAVLEAEKGKAKSVEEFRRNNKSLIDGMKGRSDVTQKEIDAMEKDIEARLKSETAMENYAKEQERQAKRLARLRNISGVFDELGARMNAFGGVLSGISSPTGAVNMGSLSAAVRPGAKDKESIKRYDSMIDLLGNIGGETPGGLSPYADEAKAGAFLERNLGSAVTLASSGGGLESEGGPAGQIMKQLGAAYERETGKKFEGSIAQKEVSEGLQGKTDEELRAAMKDPAKLEGLVGELQGNLKEVNETFKQAAEMLDNHNGMLSQAYMEHLKLEQEYVSKQQSLVDQRFAQKNASAERLSTSAFGGPSNADVQANFMEKQRMAVEGVNGIGGMSQDRQNELTAAGGVGSVDAVGAVFKNISAELQASNAKIATAAEQAGVAPDDMKTAGNLADSQKDLIEKNKQLQAEYDATKGVLESYANSQQRMIALNKELSQAQGKRKTMKELAISAKYGTAEEKDSAQKLINAIAIAQQQGIDAVAPELQKSVIGYLPNIFGAEGEGMIDKGLEDSGFGGEGITKVSAEEKRIDAEMSAIEESGIKAGEYIGQEVGMRADAMATNIESLHAKFLTDLKSLLAEDAAQAAIEDKNLAGAKGEKAAEQKAIITKAAEQLGMGQGEEAYKKFTQDQAGETKGTANERMKALLSGSLTSKTQDEAQKKVDFMSTSSAALESGEFANFAALLDYDNDDKDNFGGLSMGDAFGMTGEDLRANMEEALDEGWGNNEEIAELTKDQNNALGKMLAGLKAQYVESGMGTGSDFLDMQESVVKGLGGSAEADAASLLGGLLDQMKISADNSKTQIKDNKAMRTSLGVSETGAVDITDEEQRSLVGIKSASDVDTRAAEAEASVIAADKQILAAEAQIKQAETEKAAAAIEKSVREGETKAKFQDVAAKGLASAETIKPVEENTQLAANSLNDLATHALTQGSLYTHDIHCEVLLQAILSELTGGAGGVAMSEEANSLLTSNEEAAAKATPADGGMSRPMTGADKAKAQLNAMASGSGTAGLDDTIAKFSKATEELGGVMGNALSVEVGGTIDVNVNMNGADFLKGAKDSLGKYASQQVSKGINNFITQGLKNNNVKTRPDWVNEGGTNDIPGSDNNESGSI